MYTLYSNVSRLTGIFQIWLGTPPSLMVHQPQKWRGMQLVEWQHLDFERVKPSTFGYSSHHQHQILSIGPLTFHYPPTFYGLLGMLQMGFL